MKLSDTNKVNKILKEAKAGNIKINSVVLLFIAFLIMQIGGIPGSALGYILSASKVIDNFTNNVVFTLILSFAGALGLVILYVKKVEKRSLSSMGLTKKNGLILFLKGYGFACIMMSVIALSIFGLGGYKFYTSGNNVGISFLPLILFTILGWSIQGSTEEVLTRGWLMTSIGVKNNIYTAIFLNSAFFMILHLGNKSIDAIALLNLFLFGIFASVYFINEGTLWGICGFHAGWNWYQGNILGIEVSGNSVFGGSLIRLVPDSNKLLSGGSFGIEASLVTTVFLGLFTIYYIYNIKKGYE